MLGWAGRSLLPPLCPPLDPHRKLLLGVRTLIATRAAPQASEKHRHALDVLSEEPFVDGHLGVLQHGCVDRQRHCHRCILPSCMMKPSAAAERKQYPTSAFSVLVVYVGATWSMMFGV